MTENLELNPFVVLGLPADASLREALRRGKALVEQTVDPREQARYREAVDALRRHPAARAAARFWQPPGVHRESDEPPPG